MEFEKNTHFSQVLSQPLELPSGAILKNRLVKTAMSDSLGDGAGGPTQAQARLYQRWAEGGAALSIIGEAQVIPFYPEKPGNLVLNACKPTPAMANLVRLGQVQHTHLWPQIGHAGALSYAPISSPKGPSPLHLPMLYSDGMTTEEVEELPTLYAIAAKNAQALGFSGVQIHAGHGFLLSQFLSPLFNHRTDYYGGSIEGRAQIILRIIQAVRSQVGSAFPIGIKLNSSDGLEGGLTETDALEVIRMLARTSLDLIEISGGTYFPGAKASSDAASDGAPYFASFAKQAKAVTNIPIVLTGGVRTVEQAATVITDNQADAVGLARAMVLEPTLANLWLSGVAYNPEFPQFSDPPKGGVTAWYTMRLTALAEDCETDYIMDPHTALAVYEDRDTQRHALWRETFMRT